MTQGVHLSVFAMTLALLAGCAGQSDKTAAQPAYTPLSKRKITAVAMTNTPPNSVQSGQTVPISPQGQAPTSPPPRARVVPLTARIASVNEKLRFVIVDFTNSHQPAIDEKLGVYRVGEKVAEIKISGPYRNTTVAADIISGEVKYGDEVKTD